MECSWKVLEKSTCGFKSFVKKLEKVLGCTHADNVQGTQLLVSIVLLNSDAVVCCPSMLPWGVSSRGAAGLRFGLCSLLLVSTQQGERCYRAV